MNQDNIILIGMPGAGKSTMGVVLAKVLGYQFVDADLLIQMEEKRLLKDIINEEGLEGFLEVENRVNKNIHTSKTVIATGGSVVYGTEAMEHLREIGQVVYLKLDFDTIDSRLGNIKQRGVALKDGQTLYDLYLERCPLYERYANLTINCEKLDIEDVVNTIVESLKSNINKSNTNIE